MCISSKLRKVQCFDKSKYIFFVSFHVSFFCLFASIDLISIQQFHRCLSVSQGILHRQNRISVCVYARVLHIIHCVNSQANNDDNHHYYYCCHRLPKNSNLSFCFDKDSVFSFFRSLWHLWQRTVHKKNISFWRQYVTHVIHRLGDKKYADCFGIIFVLFSGRWMTLEGCDVLLLLKK